MEFIQGFSRKKAQKFTKIGGGAVGIWFLTQGREGAKGGKDREAGVFFNAEARRR